jgi:hypothetical protein
MWPRRTKTSTTPRKPPSVRPVRPVDLRVALDEVNATRPEFVPDHAITLVAWVTIPGDNTQRTQHWQVKRSWQEPVIRDFGACLAIQPHPGLLEKPRMHIRLIVPSAGDSRNSYGRAKFLIDRLQIKREVEYRKPEGGIGIRVHGLLGLIKDDRVFNDTNSSIEEIALRAKNGVNLQKAIIWIWEDAT